MMVGSFAYLDATWILCMHCNAGQHAAKELSCKTLANPNKLRAQTWKRSCSMGKQ